MTNTWYAFGFTVQAGRRTAAVAAFLRMGFALCHILDEMCLASAVGVERQPQLNTTGGVPLRYDQVNRLRSRRIKRGRGLL